MKVYYKLAILSYKRMKIITRENKIIIIIQKKIGVEKLFYNDNAVNTDDNKNIGKTVVFSILRANCCYTQWTTAFV